MSDKKSYSLDPDTTYRAVIADKEVTVKSEKGDYSTTNEAEQALLEGVFGFKPKESK